MLRWLIQALLPVLVLTAFTGCGGSSGGGGPSQPGLPSDATEITASNATGLAATAMETTDLVDNIADVQPKKPGVATVGDALRLVTSHAFDRVRRSPAGAAKTETVDCDSGSFTIDFEETDTSASGSVRFDQCILGGLRLAGEFEFDSKWDNNTGNYTNSGSGRISFSSGDESASLHLEYSQSGNLGDSDTSTTMRLSISGTPEANFLVTTEHAVRRLNGDIIEGVIVVHDANNSSLRVSVIEPNRASVWIDEDGGYVMHDTINLSP